MFYTNKLVESDPEFTHEQVVSVRDDFERETIFAVPVLEEGEGEFSRVNIGSCRHNL